MSYKKYYEGGWRSGETGGTPITPEALNHMENGIAGAVPLDGSTPMTGQLKLQGDFVRLSGTSGSAGLILFDKAGDSANRRVLMMVDREISPNDKFSLLYRITTNGANNDYQILNERNKPSGTYTGNGSTAERRIPTDGIGSLVLIWSTQGMAILSPRGGVAEASGKVEGIVTGSGYFSTNQEIVLATNNAILNSNGVTYNYHCL